MASEMDVEMESRTPSPSLEIADPQSAKGVPPMDGIGMGKCGNGLPVLSIQMSSLELEACAKMLTLEKAMGMSFVKEVASSAPPQVKRLKTVADLQPKAKLARLETRADGYNVRDFCLKNPIVVLRGARQVFNMDLGLYSTRTIVEAKPDQPVELRRQFYQPLHENKNLKGKSTWRYVSKTARGKPSKASTVAEYATYQSDMFLKEKNNSFPAPREEIKFATNIDLLVNEKDDTFKAQLEELHKLPPFLRVEHPSNMLHHVGQKILGMNTVQLYMKVPGCRTPAHQENNNMCSVNINAGPGDCEWWGVDMEHAEALQKLCEKKGEDFLTGSWWPDQKECEEEGIPVYQFTQVPGDIVFVNSGTVHWVQANTTCNNIAWNVGPLTAEQYHLAMERFEYNKSKGKRNLVPMIHLTWNLARNLSTYDERFYRLLKHTLMVSLVQCIKLREFAKARKIEFITSEQPEDRESTPCCEKCDIELFNTFLVKEDTESYCYIPFCLNCAKEISSNLAMFKCQVDCQLDELKNVYDDFLLREKKEQERP